MILEWETITSQQLLSIIPEPDTNLEMTQFFIRMIPKVTMIAARILTKSLRSLRKKIPSREAITTLVSLRAETSMIGEVSIAQSTDPYA